MRSPSVEKPYLVSRDVYDHLDRVYRCMADIMIEDGKMKIVETRGPEMIQ